MFTRIIRPNQKKVMPVIGKIKVGEKIERDGKEFPVSLDYFVASGNYQHIYDKKFQKPNKLDICFISDDPNECVVERLEIRQGSKLFARGDGHTFEVYDKKTDKYIIRTIEKEPDLIKKIESQCGNTFDEVLTLYFLIIGINEVFGVWQFTTKGRDSSIPKIVNSFKLAHETIGSIKFVPFKLSVEKVTSQKPDSKSVFPVISLVCNIGQEYIEKLQNHMMQGQQILGILTEEKIETATQKIEYNEEKKIEAQTIDMEFNLVPSFKDKIYNCKTSKQLKDVASEIATLELSKEQREELKTAYVDKNQELASANK